MVTQQIFLPMVPDSAPIVINISQYDFDAAGYAGRLFFNLVNAGAAYDMDGANAIFQGEKPDGTTFAYPATVVNASVVRVNVRQQMTAVSGRVVCSLILSNTDGQIGSFNVWLEVQPSSAAGGDPSQTDIPALIAQAKQYADIAEQAAEDVEAYSANPPYIGANGNWFVYDADTEQFIDTGVYAAGTEGNLWYTGTAISGKDPTPTVYPTGISTAREGDMYLNKSEGAIYQCTLGGADTVAKWAYVMTLTGGGGGGTSDYVDLDHKPQINGVTLLNNKTGSQLGLQDKLTQGNGIAIDPITLEISADLLAGSNITITPKNGKLEISSTGGGGTGGDTVSWTQIQGSSGATKIAEIDINGNTQDVYAPSGGSSLQILPDPTVDPSTLVPPKTNEQNVVDAVNIGLTEGYSNDDVTSLNTVGTWSNTVSRDYMAVATSEHPISTTGIGTWDDPSMTGWLAITDLYKISESDYEIQIKHDPTSFSGVQPVLRGWQIEDDTTTVVDGQTVPCGKICIAFANEIDPADTETAIVGFRLIKSRVPVSYITP